jgi:HSP20 family protein
MPALRAAGIDVEKGGGRMPLLEKWTPFRELDLVDHRIRRMFEELGLLTSIAPATNVYETRDAVVFEVDVPGFDEKELQVEVLDHTLWITGRREAVEPAEKEKELQLGERLEKHFQRRFGLPGEIDREHVSASYAKGVLTVRVPTTLHEKRFRVEISKS